jgi:GNAT superfamily N-acetyltransferase
MTDYSLRIERHPSQADISALETRIYEYNVASTGHTDGQELAVLLHDADGGLIGGIYGFTWDGWLDIRLFWVQEGQRGRGLGSQLLAAAEAEAIRCGCHTAIVETHSFQAPAFYQHRGFTIYATLDGYPSGQSKHSLRKRLASVAS